MNQTAGKASGLDDRAAYAETDYPRQAYRWSALRALRTGKYLFVQAPRPELYETSKDPAEQHDLAPSSPAVAGTLAAQVTAFREKTRSPDGTSSVNLNPEQVEQVNALGYIASTNSTISPIGDIDPKDEVAVVNEMFEAEYDLWYGRPKEAIRKMQAVLARDPQQLIVYDYLANAWLATGNVDNAFDLGEKEMRRP